MVLLEAVKLPIVKIAAGAVIVASAVGIGVATGLIPRVASHEELPPAATVTSTPGEVAAQPARKHVVRAPAPVAAAQPAPPVCSICGVVESVRQIEEKGQGTGLGAVVGGLTGLIVGNQIGNGKGRTLAQVAGTVGGAYAGNEIEKNAKKTIRYEITVRMDDGARRTFTQGDSNGVGVGERVKVIDNVVVHG